MNHSHLKQVFCAALALTGAAGCDGKPASGADGGVDGGEAATAVAARPKLLVTIVIDQFRADYLTRFAPQFGETGFKRLAKRGASWTGHYGQYATYTGPGHALILSGSYPNMNGISTNKFYNQETQRSEAMVFDAESEILGVKKADADMDVSPRNFIGTTVGDELALATGRQSRTVALATKGRGAILLGGRLGKSYFMNDDTGEMTTSTYYSSVLPNWVVGWNTKKLADAFLGNLAAPIIAAVPPHPREDRLVVEEAVASPRALYGWIGPAEAETGDASIRVAIEILQNPKIARLSHALVDSGLASLAQAAIDPGQRASIAAIEIAPAGSHDLAEVERRLEAELASFGDTGPTSLELAVAKAYLAARLKKELAPAPTSLAGVVHSATTRSLRRALRPGQAEKVLAAVDDVSQSSVKAAVKRVLSRDHRVVVTTMPTAKATLSAADPGAGGRSTTLR